MKTRVLLADDHAIMIEGLTRMLEAEFEVAGTVTNGRELVEATDRIKPDVIVADISMPQLNGIDAAREIRKSDPDAKIVLLTMHPEATYAKAAFEAGCSGFVLKQSSGSELREAIKEVLEGHTYITPLVAKELAEFLLQKPGFGRDLTGRQRQVLQLIAEGHSIREIAELLHISIKAVQFHKSAITKKLGLRGTADLTRYAIQSGLASW